MARLSMLLSALAATSGVTNATFVKNNATDTCKEIDGSISKASDVVFPCMSQLCCDRCRG